MKFLIFCSFVFLLVEMYGCSTKRQQNDMTEQMPLFDLKNELIVFYNVQNLFDLTDDPFTNDNAFTPSGDMAWSQERFDIKVHQLADVIHQIGNKNPLLIGLVEIENEAVVKSIASCGKLKESNYKIIHYNSEDSRGIDCALMYDSDKLRNIHQEKLSVDLDNDPDFVTRDILYFKGETIQKEYLHVFVNHWSSRRGGITATEPKRMAAAFVMIKKIEEIKAKDPFAKVLIMGDFNDHPSDKSMTSLLQIKGQQGPFLTNLMLPMQKLGKGSLVHHREWFIFDQFLVSESLFAPNTLQIEGSEAFVYKNENLLFTFPDGSSKPNATYGGSNYYGGYSDHLPIYLKLTR
jgi:predicted extracellular nuclease